MEQKLKAKKITNLMTEMFEITVQKKKTSKIITRTLGNHDSLYNRININTAKTLKSNKKRLSVPNRICKRLEVGDSTNAGNTGEICNQNANWTSG